jgi:hypothetical protein
MWGFDMSNKNNQHELDQYREASIAKARCGECEGNCEQHYGETKAVRVFNKNSGIDWGYFAYCEAARKEDAHRGMELEDV